MVITVIAQEMSCAVDRSVEYWMAQLDEALTDTRLTTLGRLNAYQRFSRDTSSLRASPSCGRADLAFLFRSIGMNAISWYVMSSSWVFLVGWIVVLLVAGMAVFGGDAGRG